MIAQEQGVRASAPPAGRPVVLAIDDQPEVLAALKRLLRDEPYEFRTTSSAKEALEWVAAGPVHLVIADERMPDMRGTDLLEEIRTRSPLTVRVILTGYPGSATIHYGLAHSVEWLISKPWNDDALRLTIRQLLENRTLPSGSPPRPRGGRRKQWAEGDFAEFCEHAPVPLDGVGTNGMILWANPAELELLGYRRQEYVGRLIGEFHAEPGTAEALLTRLRDGETVRNFEARLRRKDGTILDVLIDANGLWEDGRFVHSRCMTRDITVQKRAQKELDSSRAGLETRIRERTRDLREANDDLIREIAERKRAEETLRLSEMRFRLLVDGVKDYAIFMLSTEGVIVSWNIGAQRTTGYAAEEILGRSVSHLYTPEDASGGKAERLLSTAAREDRAEDEGWRRRKDGSLFWCNSVITAVRDPAGTLLGFSKVTRDMTERRRAEEERARLNAQMLQGQKLQAIGQLSAGIAHEINNPVGYILSNLSTMGEYCEDLRRLLGHALEAARALEERRDPADSLREFSRLEHDLRGNAVLQDLREVVADCKLGTERIRDIVRSLREFSHVDEGELKPADLNKCVEDALRISWNELKYKAEVVRDFGEIPKIPGYAQRLGQVFINLLVNAGQAIEKKGRIQVTTRVEGPEAVVRVRDTGSGIAPENLRKIFEPFFTTKPVGSGTGLGLHVAHKIITAHGGRIEVQSRVGEGTEFAVRLPLSGPASAAR